MKAIQITQFGGPDVMQLVDLPDPVPSDAEELIEVSCIGINYADTHQTENSYLSAQTLPLVPGIEVVGTFESNSAVNFISTDTGITFTLTAEMAAQIAPYQCGRHAAMTGNISAIN